MYRYMVERLSKCIIFYCLLTQSVQQELYTFAVLAYCSRWALLNQYSLLSLENPANTLIRILCEFYKKFIQTGVNI
jgi:hypothetical protein